MRFTQLFAGRTSRSEMVGLFLALLELVKQKRVLASQGDNFDDIHVHLTPDPPEPEEDELPAEESADAQAGDGAAGQDARAAPTEPTAPVRNDQRSGLSAQRSLRVAA